MKTVDDNLLYIADSSLKIVAFNQAAKEAFPSMETGKECPEAVQQTQAEFIQAEKNTLGASDSSSTTVFNFTLCRWINISITSMEYPGHGKCYYFSGTFYNSMNREIMSHVNFMNKWTFAINMNLTLDKYIYISEENFGEKFQLPEEPLSKLIKRMCATVVHPDDHKKFMDLMNTEDMFERLEKAKKPVSEVIREKNSSGSWDDVTFYLVPEEYKTSGYKMVFAFMYVNLIPANRLNKSNLEKDQLTGLFTKQSFQKAADEFLKQSSEELCLISMDIEHFRFFNKWYSRWQGDRLLKRIALVLHEMDRLFDSVSGYGGGDNFYIIVYKHDAVLKHLTETLSSLISNFDGIEGFRIVFGGYEIKDKTEDILDAMDYATTASNNALNESENKIFWYDSKMVKDIEHDLQLITEIERGLEEKEFTFYLQPKCSIEDNKIVGAEALVRWNSKYRGFISPGDFIPVLERKGNVTKLDAFIWEAVCKKLREWIDQGITPVPVSVNVSRIDIFNLNVPVVFSELIEKYKINPKLLEIEVTESAFMDDTKILKNVIQRLRDKGFTILIDDFGSGYSSLNMLKDVQADILKMDMKFFVLDNTNYEKGINIIKSVINLSHNMNLPVIAEGVETSEQIKLLKSMGLNYVQGFYYYKPVPIKEYEGLIADRNNISTDGIKLN